MSSFEQEVLHDALSFKVRSLWWKIKHSLWILPKRKLVQHPLIFNLSHFEWEPACLCGYSIKAISSKRGRQRYTLECVKCGRVSRFIWCGNHFSVACSSPPKEVRHISEGEGVIEYRIATKNFTLEPQEGSTERGARLAAEELRSEGHQDRT